MRHKKRVPLPRVSIKLLLCIVFLTALLFLFDILYVWKSYQSQKSIVRTNSLLSDLSSAIIRLDRVRNMSLEMAAQNGQDRWHELYRQNKAELDAAIKETRLLAPDIFTSTNAIWIGSANKKLEVMDNLIFYFARNGRINDANILLKSKGYEEEKQTFINCLNAISSSVKRKSASGLNSIKLWFLFCAGTAAVILPALLIISVQALDTLKKEKKYGKMV